MKPAEFSYFAPADRMQIKITDSHIDFMGHVNNAQYLSWAQEATLAYWRSHAPRGAVDTMAWVALEHVIRYRQPVLLGETLVVKISVTEVRGSRARFTTRFLRQGHEVASLASSWCCICTKSRRPFRIPKNVFEEFLLVDSGVEDFLPTMDTIPA